MAALDASDNVNEAENAARLLSEAVNSGDKEEAAKRLDELLDLKLPVTVTLKPEAYCQDAIRLRVGVADAVSDVHIPMTVPVPVYITISELKEKISHDYGFHPTLQRWVIGKRLAQDNETLFHCGIRNHNDSAFLFIMTAQAAELSRNQERKDKEDRRIEGITENIENLDLTNKHPPDLLPRGHIPPPLPPKPQVGWSCPSCTYVNKPMRPGCEMCSTARPDETPDLYEQDEEEAARLEEEERANLQY